MAPSTPPPPSRLELAALTMASTSSRVMSPTMMSIMGRPPAAPGLLSHPQARLAAAARRVVVRWRGPRGLLFLVLEGHASAVLAGVDGDHRGGWDAHRLGASGETRAEGDIIVLQHQPLNRRRADVEHDLAVLHVLAGHHYVLALGIHDEVGRHVVVDDPVEHGPDHVRSGGGHGEYPSRKVPADQGAGGPATARRRHQGRRYRDQISH